MKTRIKKDSYTFSVAPNCERVVLRGRLLKQCAVCGHVLPFSHTGMRNMTNTTDVRDQPRCGPCRQLKKKDGHFEHANLPTIIGDIHMFEYETPERGYVGFIQHADPEKRTWRLYIREDGSADFYPDVDPRTDLSRGTWARSHEPGTHRKRD